MDYLIYFFLLLLACLLVTYLRFVRNSGLSKSQVIVLFILKAAAGIALGWMAAKYYPQGNDYWDLNREGWIENKLLMSDPGEFFYSLFRSPYTNGYDGLFNSVGSYWNDLKNNLIIKVLALLNTVTRGNYYSNSLFFCILSFLGSISLFRVFSDIFPGKKWIMVLGCFLLPSTLYFSSSIHKDSIVFAALGLLCYSIYFSLKENTTSRRALAIIIALLTLWLMRNYVVIALVPATIALFISYKKYQKPEKRMVHCTWKIPGKTCKICFQV